MVPMLPTLFLDVDGVLIERGPTGDRLHADAMGFLAFVTARFEVAWATTHCRHGDAGHVLAYLDEHAAPAERDELARLAARVRPTRYRTLKTELFLDGACADWLWIEDAPLAFELDQLRERGLRDHWLQVDVNRRPDDLREARRRLERLVQTR